MNSKLVATANQTIDQRKLLIKKNLIIVLYVTIGVMGLYLFVKIFVRPILSLTDPVLQFLWRYEGFAAIFHVPMAILLIGAFTLKTLNALSKDRNLYSKYANSIHRLMKFIFLTAAAIGVSQTLISFCLMLLGISKLDTTNPTAFVYAFLNTTTEQMSTAFGSTVAGMILSLLATTFLFIEKKENIMQ